MLFKNKYSIIGLALILFIVPFLSCAQKKEKYKVNPVAVQLNYQAMDLMMKNKNVDSLRKGLALLEKATELDSNYFLGHFNKTFFYNRFKEFDKSLTTIKKLIQLSPLAPDLYTAAGLYFEKLGPTDSAKKYFTTSSSMCDKVLDTMSEKNKSYLLFASSKFIDLLMLGDFTQANYWSQKFEQVAEKQLGKGDIDSIYKKNKKQFLESIFEPEKMEGSATH